MIRIVLSDTRFHAVFHKIYLGSRKLPHIDLSLVVYSLSNVPFFMLSPNTKTFLISLVFVFQLAFLILSLLVLSVDTITFVDFFCRFLSEWIVGDLLQVFLLLTSTTLLKTSLRVLLLGELDFGFLFDDSRIRAITFSFSDVVLIMAVFIGFLLWGIWFPPSEIQRGRALQLIEMFFFQKLFYNKYLLKEEGFQCLDFGI